MAFPRNMSLISPNKNCVSQYILFLQATFSKPRKLSPKLSYLFIIIGNFINYREFSACYQGAEMLKDKTPPVPFNLSLYSSLSSLSPALIDFTERYNRCFSFVTVSLKLVIDGVQVRCSITTVSVYLNVFCHDLNLLSFHLFCLFSLILRSYCILKIGLLR